VKLQTNRQKLTFINQRNGRVASLCSSWIHAYSKA